MTSNRPLRVLQIGKYFPPDEGGIETVTDGISRALAIQNVKADVLCIRRNLTYPELDLDFEIFRAKVDFTMLGKSVSLDYAWKLRKLNSRYDVGLLHMPNVVGMVSVLAFWKKPLVLLWHSDIVGYPRIQLMLSRMERRLIAAASAVISPTPAHVEGSIHSKLLRPKATVVPFPFDNSRFSPSVHTSENIRRLETFVAGRRMLLAVGRLVSYKGFDVLIECASSLNSDVAVCIIGDGPLREQLAKQIVQRNLSERVLLAGRFDDAELRSAFQRAWVVTMPSVTRAEMYGIVQVEAMSFGKPVISTDIPFSGVPYVNQNDVSGLVVTPGDTASLAQAINRLASDSALYSVLSKGAKDRFHELNDSVRSGAAYASLLAEVVPNTIPS